MAGSKIDGRLSSGEPLAAGLLCALGASCGSLRPLSSIGSLSAYSPSSVGIGASYCGDGAGAVLRGSAAVTVGGAAEGPAAGATGAWLGAAFTVCGPEAEPRRISTTATIRLMASRAPSATAHSGKPL